MIRSLALLTLLAGAAQATVFLRPAEAARWIATHEATVLDARGRDATPPFIPGAVRFDWRDHVSGGVRSGRLAEPAKVAAALQQLGVANDRAVLVYGAARDGWGEEARAWWTLRYLGVREVRILDGGLRAWRRAGHPTDSKPGTAKVRGRLRVTLEAGLRVDTDAVARLRDGRARILDVRRAEEYAGATPYWSSRGGHVPGARHLHWKAVLDADGFLRPAAELEQRFAAAGVTRGTPVVTYCTGGVRSAFVQAALVHLGYAAVANYDGSWWAWSARADLPVRTLSRD